MPSTTYQTGVIAEAATRDYLEKQGLVFLDNHFNKPFGEIDLIMKDGDIIVFVEVRMRTDQPLLDILESITKSKQKKIKKTATLFLLKKDWYDKIQCRFDVVAVTPKAAPTNVDPENAFDFYWIKNAF